MESRSTSCIDPVLSRNSSWSIPDKLSRDPDCRDVVVRNMDVGSRYCPYGDSLSGDVMLLLSTSVGVIRLLARAGDGDLDITFPWLPADEGDADELGRDRVGVMHELSQLLSFSVGVSEPYNLFLDGTLSKSRDAADGGGYPVISGRFINSYFHQL
jgi:hypothetical protein